MPRSNRLWYPESGGDWFGGKSSTRMATFWIRLRNSSGSESNASSAVLMKSARFILHPLRHVTPSSRHHHHRHLLYRHHRLRFLLPLRLLPRLALLEAGDRQLPTDQKTRSREILDVFCSCPIVRRAVQRSAKSKGTLRYAAFFAVALRPRLSFRTTESPRFNSALRSVSSVAISTGSPADSRPS